MSALAGVRSRSTPCAGLRRQYHDQISSITMLFSLFPMRNIGIIHASQFTMSKRCTRIPILYESGGRLGMVAVIL